MEQARKRLAIVWLALMVLLALTVTGSFTVTGAASAVVSFGVAAAKVALIFWFFMQLRTEKGLIRVRGRRHRLAGDPAHDAYDRQRHALTNGA